MPPSSRPPSARAPGARPPSARGNGKETTPRSARKTPSPKTSGKKKKVAKAGSSATENASLFGEDEIVVEEEEDGVPADSAALLREALRGTPADQETGSPSAPQFPPQPAVAAPSAAASAAAPPAAPPAALAAVPAADERITVAVTPSTEHVVRARAPSPERAASPEPHLVEGTTEDTAAASKKEHRHRWVLKHGPGQKLGLTLSTHPTLPEVYVVSHLNVDGACANNGVRVGDLINKVNGEVMPTVQAAIERIDDIWSHEADDPAKDRLKLSLADRTSE